jgi:hypothetical protein
MARRQCKRVAVENVSQAPPANRTLAAAGDLLAFICRRESDRLWGGGEKNNPAHHIHNTTKHT